MKKVLLMMLGVMVVGAVFAGSADWPEFRGPGGDGVSSDIKGPLKWDDSTNIKWKADVEGYGHSSPVIGDGRIWLTTAIHKNERKERYLNNQCIVTDSIRIKVLCYSLKEGKLIWSKELWKIDKPTPVHTLNSYTTPTPFLDGDMLYCDFGEFGTACLEAESGTVKWEKKLVIDHEVGPGSSPIVYKDLLILVRDGRDKQYVTALDKKSGKEVWVTKRPAMKGKRTDFHKAFSTPSIIESKGKTQVVVPGAQWIISYDPVTGKELWRSSHGKGFSIAPRPSIGNGMVYYASGFMGNHVLAVRHNGKGNVTGSAIAWKERRWAPTIPSPLVRGKELFWVSDQGIAVCADAVSGEIIWHKRLGGRFLASPLCANGKLYFVNTIGMTWVVDASREYKVVSLNKLNDQQVSATPAFADDSLILRTHTSLYRISDK